MPDDVECVTCGADLGPGDDYMECADCGDTVCGDCSVPHEDHGNIRYTCVDCDEEEEADAEPAGGNG